MKAHEIIELLYEWRTEFRRRAYNSDLAGDSDAWLTYSDKADAIDLMLQIIKEESN